MQIKKPARRPVPQLVLSSQFALIVVALLVGALLRLVGNDRPFPTSDHAELAAIVSFFYPRSLRALGISGASSWQLLTNAHGTLPPLIGLLGSTLIGLSGIQLNEFWWNLPFVLVNLLSVPLAGLLVTRLERSEVGRGAGTLAAVLIALLPIHAALSRASGLSHIPLTFFCQTLTIWCFVRYFETPTPQHARRAGLALALNLQVELFFPLLFVLLLGVGLLTVEPGRSWQRRLYQARRLLFRPQVMLLPLLAVCFNFALLLGYINGWTTMGGIAARLLEGSDRQPGLYLADFWDNARYVVGTPALLLLIGLGLLGLPALWRLEQRAISLLWAGVYLVPFVLFTRPHVYEYFLLGLAPLTLNAAIVIARWWHAGWPRRGLTLVAPLLLGLFSLRALAMIFGLNLVPVAGTGLAPGAVFADQGLKAAAWWIRSHTPDDALVFADSNFEPYQLAYYTHRPFLAVTDAETPVDAYQLLRQSRQRPAVYLVTPGHEVLLQQYAGAPPQLTQVIRADGQPVLLIYTDRAGPPTALDVSDANIRFDREFGRWGAMFDLPAR